MQFTPVVQGIWDFLGAAEVGAVLFGKDLQVDPSDDQWLNRDRFVLSAGHGSMFLYGWLHLAGYDLPLEEVKNFRQLHSKTPVTPSMGKPQGSSVPPVPLVREWAMPWVWRSLRRWQPHILTPRNIRFLIIR